MSLIMNGHSQEKLSALSTSTKPHHFKLFTKSKVLLGRWFSAGWIDSFKSQKPSSTNSHPQQRANRALSQLLCCVSDGGSVFQEKDGRDSHDGAEGSAHDTRTCQTITSFSDLGHKEKGSQENIDQSTKETSFHEHSPAPMKHSASIASSRSSQSSHSMLGLNPEQEKSAVQEQHTVDHLATDCSETTTPALESGQGLWLLKPIAQQDQGRKCLVLDLDETLVHSSFKPPTKADFVVPVEINGEFHNVFVLKRPGVDAFMKRMGEMYEIVVFTASLSKYAGPVLDIFDHHRVVRHRLFRESCFHYNGTYVKDLSQLGRDLDKVIILDNSPASYIFHSANAVPVSTWFNDPHDSELTDLIPFLEDLARVDDVTDVLDNTIPGPFSYF